MLKNRFVCKSCFFSEFFFMDFLFVFRRIYTSAHERAGTFHCVLEDFKLF